VNGNNEALSVWLDLIRWVSAFEVLIFHVRHRLLLPLGQLDHSSRSIAFYLLNVISGFGAPSVLIFFVLSGFLVGGGSLRQFKDFGHFNMLNYSASRFLRLWIVIFPTFLLTFILDRIAISAFSSSGNEIYQLDGIGSVETSLTTSVLLCNAFFMQTALCPQYGENGALWSLFNEFWYYMAWPPLMLALYCKLSYLKTFIFIVIAFVPLLLLSRIQFIGPNIFIYFTLWLFGVAAAEKSKPFISIPPIFSGTLLGISLLVWRIFSLGEVQGTNLYHEYPFDIMVTFFATNFIMTLKCAPRLALPPLSKIHSKIANFSFTLYCIHTPLINFFCAFLVWRWGVGWHMAPVGWLPYVLYMAITTICLVASYTLALFTESHTLKIRKYVLSRIPSRPFLFIAPSVRKGMSSR
jgi:peptidoglycan/LPS O-acetylase OafA/YrhL